MSDPGLDLLKKMVSVYAPSGEEERLVEYLGPKMEEMGYDVQVDGTGNLIGKAGEGDVEVALIGHLDTVPGQIDVRIKDGSLYGRGSVDAQGPLASFIDAGKEYVGSEALSVYAVGVVEEETTSKGAYALVEEISPDFVVVGEPSNWDGITLGYRGSFLINYELSAPKTHRGEGSPIPAEEAVKFYQGFSDFLGTGNEGFFGDSVRLTKIVTGDDPFADHVRMRLNVRLAPGADLEEIRKFIEENAGSADVSTTRVIPPVRAPKRNKLVSAFLGGIRGQGGEPGFKLKTGTADMNIFAEDWDVPIIAYGPGDSSMDHTPDEHLELVEYERAREVLVAALRTLEKVYSGNG